MANPFESEERLYTVLVNAEGQYSLWPADHIVPDGWNETDKRGNRKECLDWVDVTWQDLRPRSLVEKMNSNVK